MPFLTKKNRITILATTGLAVVTWLIFPRPDSSSKLWNDATAPNPTMGPAVRLQPSSLAGFNDGFTNVMTADNATVRFQVLGVYATNQNEAYAKNNINKVSDTATFAASLAIQHSTTKQLKDCSFSIPRHLRTLIQSSPEDFDPKARQEFSRMRVIFDNNKVGPKLPNQCPVGNVSTKPALIP